MPRFHRVKDKTTGHEFSVVNVNEDAHILLDKPGEDSFGRALPAKPNIPKGGTARKSTTSGSTPENKEAQK